ncbi:hypothetical protein VSP9026_02983 [Vibrio spartinae]|uniref:Uncharacterized protein n=1 Tax=Vibrio spartinae TaxID=1918945 RepID=A0A1N6M711_9VIBR|nr:hypothetical protein VSP9026_02983 [Vibrio spartinae]
MHSVSIARSNKAFTGSNKALNVIKGDSVALFITYDSAIIALPNLIEE